MFVKYTHIFLPWKKQPKTVFIQKKIQKYYLASLNEPKYMNLYEKIKNKNNFYRLNPVKKKKAL